MGFGVGSDSKSSSSWRAAGSDSFFSQNFEAMVWLPNQEPDWESELELANTGVNKHRHWCRGKT